MFKLLMLFYLTGFVPNPVTGNDPNRICGKWISSEKNLIVQVYKDGETFRAKLVWYDNADNTKTMDEWEDIHNPNPALRTRKLIGMSLVRDLIYVPKSNSWEDGKIYDAKNGHEWSASIRIDDDGELKVTGYWHFKFIGRTLTFTRI